MEARGGALAAASEIVSVGLSRGASEGGRLGNLRAELWHMSRLAYGGVSLDQRCVSKQPCRHEYAHRLTHELIIVPASSPRHTDLMG